MRSILSLTVLAAALAQPQPVVELAVDAASASYSLFSDGTLMLASSSSPVSLCVGGSTLDVGDGSLTVTGNVTTVGSDGFGAFSALTLILSNSTLEFSFNVSFVTYTSLPAIVFRAGFPQAVSFAGCGASTSQLATWFPSWALTNSSSSGASGGAGAGADRVYTHVLGGGRVHHASQLQRSRLEALSAASTVAPVSATGLAYTWAADASSRTTIAAPGAGGIGNLGSGGLDHGPIVFGDAPGGNAAVISTLDNHKIIGQSTQTNSLTPVTSLWSASRRDQIACVTEACFEGQKGNGNYTVQRIEGYAVITVTSARDSSAQPPMVRIRGRSYATTPLTVHYSAQLQDNAVLTNSSAPPGYTSYRIADGFVLASQPPDVPTAPLQVWYRLYNTTHADFASVASADGVAWAQANNYTYMFDAGYVFVDNSAVFDTYYAQGVTSAIASGLPAGWAYATMVFAGVGGPTATVYAWGSALQRYYNTSRMESVNVKYITYYTDDGAYYYVWEAFNIPARPWPAEEGLLLVIEALNAQGIYPGALQLDDWWYDGPFYFGNVKAIVNWTGDNSTRLFPNGLPAFQSKLNLPLILYTPFWDSAYQTPYNMTPSTAFSGTKLVTPADSYPFFRDLMAQGQMLANGHMRGYEIDFLGANFVGSASMFETVDSAHMWYAGMAAATAEAGVTVQYCLSYPSDILIALEFPSVTNARASGDYVNKDANAAEIGGSALLFGALAMAPSKDTLWTTSPQPPTMSDTERNYTTQPHTTLDVILATLSGGPIGISDCLNYTNAALVQQTCMTDGSTLRASRPISWIDSHFFNGSTSADVRVAHAALPGVPYAGQVAGWYALAWKSGADVPLLPGDLYPPPPQPGMRALTRVHNATASAPDAGCVDGAALDAACANVTTCDAVVVPASGTDEGDVLLMRVHPELPNGWFLLGELSKIASLAPQRFTSVDVSGGNLVVTVAGVAAESVCVTAVSPDSVVHQQCVTLATGGSAVLTFTTAAQ